MAFGSLPFQTDTYTSVNALPDADKAAVLDKVRTFDDFTAENDPYGEHEECMRKLAALETAITLAEAER